LRQAVFRIYSDSNYDKLGKLQASQLAGNGTISCAVVPGRFSSTSQDCLACHNNRTLSMSKGGQTVALFVDEARLKESIHAALPA